MKFRPYPEYRDSGVDWLGPIPAHWKVRRLRYLTRLNPSKADLRGVDPNLPVSFLPMEAVGEYGGLKLEATRHVGSALEGYTYFRDGDVVVAKITPCFENGKGALAVDLENGIAVGTTELHVLRPTHGVRPAFLFYLTLGEPFRRRGAGAMYGAGGQKRVPEDFVRDFKQPVPGLAEQDAIVAALNAETARIDGLVASKERLIELLEEKRAALISHAVTKGLHPNVPMKDSGVEWLGQMPAGWGLVPSTWLFTEGKQRASDGDDQLSATQKYGVIPQAEFERLEGRQVVHQFLHLEQRKHVEIDDFVMSMRSFEGGLERARARGCVRSSYVVLRCSADVHVAFFSYLFKSSAYIQALRATSNFIRDGQDLNFENFRLVRLPLIPLREQEAIAAFLDRKARHVEVLVANVRTAVDRLKEYRAALISAAVTGKIDLRGEAG